MSAPDLAELRRLLAKARAHGPWSFDTTDHGDGVHGTINDDTDRDVALPAPSTTSHAREPSPRGAGPERNARMLAEGRPDLVVAFPGGTGTADMVRRAKAAGVRVVEVVEPVTAGGGE